MNGPHNPISERVVILTPQGRDAAIAQGLLNDGAVRSIVVMTLPDLVQRLTETAGAVLATDEALRTADVHALAAWLADQPAWSDMPFIVLTRQGGGLERNPDAARLSQLLGNVTFLERPFHPTTLVSIVRTALRGRRRQYEARSRLEDLRASEERLRDLNGTLAQRVDQEINERASAEEAMRQSQKMEAVGQLTGGVAHDFNNLLTIIRSSVDFLRRPELPEARKARYLDAVSETVDRAAKLTGQLLAFARRQALKPEVFDVAAKLRGIGDMLDTVTGARMRLVIEVPHRPHFVRADLSQFETALVNMAVNARDAMDGEGRLTLRLIGGQPMPPIRGHAASESDFVAVVVSDTGTGIAPDQLSRIFEPFFTTKEVGKGTGLGLSQVFGFAKQSGGDVSVHSVVGEGTTFTLYLPELGIETTDAMVEDTREPSIPLEAGLKVLVVEDNVEVGRFCTQILEDLGYDTTWAVNGEEALRKLGDDGAGFDAVFSDVVMPGMGGIVLAETLRKRLPDLPVILASGYSHVLAREDDHGFELLHKPYSADQLAKALQKAIVSAPARHRHSVTA